VGALDVIQQYYIATTSAPADDRAHVLKYGSTFFVFDRLGDVQTQGLGEQGLFFEGTRHLSKLSLNLWNAAPLLLSSSVAADNFMFVGHFANLDVLREPGEIVTHRGTLHLSRSRFLWQDACYEELLFINYGSEALEVPLCLEFGADFADIFEVRGMHREQKGELTAPEITANSITLCYRGLDEAVRRTLIESRTAPLNISATEMRFALSIQPKEKVHYHIAIHCNAENRARTVSYSSAVKTARAELSELEDEFPKISSSNSRFTDWLGRSTSDVRMMMFGNPERDYPYAGIPWFGTVFGRDGIITALQTLWLNPSIARGVLQYLSQTQADHLDASVEAEPGKILHEMRCGEMAALGEVPFGQYYGSVDATPLFIMLAGAYYERTADRAFIEEIWPNIEGALHWIDKYGDADGDGLIEYARRSERGLVQQGWKDSDDSVFHSDGKIADPPIALCEVQGYVYAAKIAAARLSGILKRTQQSNVLAEQAAKLRSQFEEHFWCDDLGTYALALDGHKKPCRVKTSNAGHCLYTGIASTERGLRVAETLLQREFFSGWGIRTVASGEARYNPLSYHNGSVWPHDNSIIAAGLGQYGRKDLAAQILIALLDLSDAARLRRLPELICGLRRRPQEGPTLYPVACSPQAWAAATPFLILQTCLGLRIEAEHNRIVFDRPRLPEGVPQLTIKGLTLGKSLIDLFIERRGDSVLVHRESEEGDVQIVAII
jgi:glycogen debranching enzyme